MKGLLKNVHNNLGKKYLKAWVNRGTGDMVELSPREYNLLKLIQQGGILPKQFHSKKLGLLKSFSYICINKGINLDIY